MCQRLQIEPSTGRFRRVLKTEVCVRVSNLTDRSYQEAISTNIEERREHSSWEATGTRQIRWTEPAKWRWQMVRNFEGRQAGLKRQPHLVVIDERVS